MPEVKGTDDNGKSASTKSDGWVFVTIGARWCKPCRKELGAWDQLAGEFLSKARFVAVDIDEDKSIGKQFHADLKLGHLEGLYTGSGNVGDLGSVMPSTYVVDPKGVIRYERCGFEDQAVDKEIKAMRAALEKLLP